MGKKMRPSQRSAISGRVRAVMNTPAVDDRLIDVVASDKEETARDTELIAQRRSELGSTFYSSLISALVGLTRPEAEAEALWNKLLHHKFEMSQKIGRNVGVRVAAMDFFSNITGDLSAVRVIDSQVLLKTAMMAITDELTGLFNHRYFQDRLRQEIEVATQESGILSLIIFDIDFFKVYNDVNGHVAGDVALHQVAERCREVVGEQGICARYGGEEFAVILPQCNKRAAATLAEEIRATIESTPFPNQFVLPSGNLTISLGVGEFPLDGSGRRDLIEYADRCMYHSKRCGKNRVTFLAPNRRRRRRDAHAYPLIFTNCESNELPDSFPGNTVNLSKGGMLVETEIALPQNMALHIQIQSEILPEGTDIFGVVTRCVLQGENTWQSGIRFVRMPDETAQRIQVLLGPDNIDPAEEPNESA
jgi:diguanylate cyclase (GGDEF)-like protein